jgi:hypothetical protein
LAPKKQNITSFFFEFFFFHSTNSFVYLNCFFLKCRCECRFCYNCGDVFSTGRCNCYKRNSIYSDKRLKHIRPRVSKKKVSNETLPNKKTLLLAQELNKILNNYIIRFTSWTFTIGTLFYFFLFTMELVSIIILFLDNYIIIFLVYYPNYSW